MALIDVRNVSKIYTGEGTTTRAIQSISCTIDEGEFVAIMGPSGSGKSTLLHILGFLDRPTSGQYMFDGQRVDALSDDALAHVRSEAVGFVFQTFNLLPRTTVLDNVKLPLLYSRMEASERHPAALRALEDVGMTHRLQHTPAQLSGGEGQRVAIARAMVNDAPPGE